MIRRTVLRIIVLAWIGIACSGQTASAHTSSYGYSKWHIHDRDIQWTLVIDDKSILELGPIDSNRDGRLSQDEAETGCAAVIKPYLEKKLTIFVNGASAAYELVSLSIVNSNELQMKFKLESKRPIQAVRVSYYLFYDSSNNLHKNIAVFDFPANSFQPAEHIFESAAPTWELQTAAGSTSWNAFGRFIKLGVEHILTGYDHILFLLSLLVIGLTLRQTLWIITSFTAAHSITLAMAVLELVKLNPRWIEIAIALTICYVAAENIWKGRGKYRWLLTYAFGLIHGFGFANVLADMAIPRSELAMSLIGFNAGVEAGQLALLAVVLPGLHVLGKSVELRRITVVTSAIIFMFGLLWFIERQFDIAILGF